MSIAQRLPAEPQDPQDEFASIEAAVAGTARGRWFLDEYVRRAQSRDNERIIATLTRIERMLTADAQARQPEARQSDARHAEPQSRQSLPTHSAASFTPHIAPSPAQASQGAALPVLSALRANGAMSAPIPAPRPAQPAAAVRSPARSLSETLEQALLATQPKNGAAAASSARAPETRTPEPRKAEQPASSPAASPAGRSLATPLAKLTADKPRAPSSLPSPSPPPYVPPAPALSPKAPLSPSPAIQRREPAPSISLDAGAFAEIEAMDAAMRAKLFA